MGAKLKIYYIKNNNYISKSFNTESALFRFVKKHHLDQYRLNGYDYFIL